MSRRKNQRNTRLSVVESDVSADEEILKRERAYRILLRETERLANRTETSDEVSLKYTYRDAMLDSLGQLELAFLQLTDEGVDDNFTEFTKIKDQCLRLKACCATNQAAHHAEVEGISSKEPAGVRLPKIGLVDFNGEKNKWLSFKDLFSNAIIKNTTLTDVQRLSYLQACVKNEAARLIAGFQITGENFQHAWQSLCNRYENVKELTFAHLRKIFEIKSIKSANSKNLLELVDVLNESLRNLKTLGLEPDKFTETIFVFHLQSKLDSETLRQWELHSNSKEVSTLASLIEFLEQQARGFLATSSVAKTDIKPHKTTLLSNNTTVSNLPNLHCSLCNANHQIFKCPQFSKLNLTERWDLVKSKRLCANCLKSNHLSRQCMSKNRCKNCHRNHHTSLHSYTTDSSNNHLKGTASTPLQSNTEAINLKHDNKPAPCLSVSAAMGCNTLLSTAKIRVQDSKGNFVLCKALIDNGSQKTLISRNLQERLQLETKASNYSIMGINNTKAETTWSEVSLTFSSHFGSELFTIPALVVTRVTSNLPNFYIQREPWPHLHHLMLADPEFYISSPVDVLIGADLFLDLIVGSPIVGPFGSPSALDTKLGFILSGSLSSDHHLKTSLSCHTTFHLDQQLQQFWDIEAIPVEFDQSEEDRMCEEMFQRSVTRDHSGRYSVGLPLKPNVLIGDTYHAAKKRFHTLERQLERQPKLKQQYVNFMQDYLQLNHMEPVPANNIPSQVFYLPHHAVTNERSTTTKLRVVFDGSVKSSSGVSLNEAQLTGPKLQASLFALLVQFRIFPVVLNADIKQMYRQINISPEHIDLQRILWRPSPSHPLQEFRLRTVTYGLSSSPYLALRTLKQLASDEVTNFPEATKILNSHFYIDDLLAGAENVASAVTLTTQLNELLHRGGFTLRKWSSNCPEALALLSPELVANSSSITIAENTYQTILGVKWNQVSDTFHINIDTFPEVTSKRSLLSLIARIFDPLGILSPATIVLKIQLQVLWKSKIGWDDTLPDNILQHWQAFKESVNILHNIQIPRYLHLAASNKCQLIGFADASIKAYAAVLYLRAQTPSGQIFVTFLASKTRVAPTKEITLPRLELSAALLLAQLVQAVTPCLPSTISDTLLWSDSEIVLCWIMSGSNKHDSFVAHRIQKIHTLTNHAIWSHVPSQDNPADCASRGILPKQLFSHPLWWTGPPWLHELSLSDHLSTNMSILSNFTSPDSNSDESLAEQPPSHVVHNLTISSFSEDFLSKFSSFTKLLRVMAWILRFIHNSHCPSSIMTGFLKSEELLAATHCIIKLLQKVEFQSELLCLQQNHALPKTSKFLSLNIFLDSAGIIRVGGRLSKNTNLPFEHRHPALLPARHHVTTLLINYLHVQHLHAGPQLVLSILWHRFWILNGRAVVRQVLHRCIVCFRLHSKPEVQLMGNLPKERITLIRPFLTVGVDFTGHFLTRPESSRSKVRFKSYLCLFVCMSTKAVHLELVSELSSNAFLACFRRFVGRRGLPTDVFSDNATNFRGAANYLNQFHLLCKGCEVQTFCSDHLIKWHFIPAYSPNFGGLWESSIKLVKAHLLRTLKSSLLTFEQLYTLLCQIEALINSRPIVPMSNDPTDLQSLTPGHFIIGCPMTDLPDGSSQSSSMTLPAKWALLQQMRHHFWNRWQREYLSHLQPCSKWRSNQHNLQVGQLVLIREPNLPPLQWMTGRVLKSFPGTDGHVRVVSLQTKRGVITRSLCKLSPFPQMSNSPSQP